MIDLDRLQHQHADARDRVRSGSEQRAEPPAQKSARVQRASIVAGNVVTAAIGWRDGIRRRWRQPRIRRLLGNGLVRQSDLDRRLGEHGKLPQIELGRLRQHDVLAADSESQTGPDGQPHAGRIAFAAG